MNKNLLLNFEHRRCCKCVMPEIKGHIDLNDKGECALCSEYRNIEAENTKFDSRSSEEKKKIFLQKVKKFRSEGKYDCMVAVSGGKDSIMTLAVAHELGLNPLAFFVDNGFALPEMFDNIRNACDIMGIDWLTFRTTDMKRIFKVLLESRKNIYYCRVCHILLEDIIKTTCLKNGIRLILGGYTKGQSYLKQNALSWIFEESDRNTIAVLEADGSFSEYMELFSDPIKYAMKNHRGVTQISPFKYLDYNEEEIIRTLEEKYKFKLPQNSWPKHSTNCAFNQVSQYLAVQRFGYSQHETEFSDLVRSGELSRQQAENLMNTPITENDLQKALDILGLGIDVVEKNI